ncbi:unnamed protein product [Zymoseptoria tritici ST99CH_1E4]|uniref:Uncharacterized protein n=1 Tax=Zymoseptoria tritici ST99CH_1E4 TaxID=1276532 RepID=A0A2H1H4J7_ZYMTR|nr:unnamed protein product [Zymoseptoria tritici ST99CH_1E4]
MESTPIQITEYDNADNVSNVYVQSSAGGDAKGMSRVDVIPPKKGDERSYLQQGMDSKPRSTPSKPSPPV